MTENPPRDGGYTRPSKTLTHASIHITTTEAKEREKELAEQAEKLGETLEEAGIRTRRQKQKGMVRCDL